ncbi:MAG: beta-hydroxyacyl-ACP dehydratase [Bacteroidaceae bacterium]|nr:beta-hydroxyacyl-ACP dehydratase [Bacteroidaceae bacterium]
MKLLNDFFTINSSAENGNELIYNIHLNKEHFIYAAHFPGNPITPGVCIMQMVQELIEQHLNAKLQLKTLNNIKYMSVISPVTDADISIGASYTQNDGTVKIKGVIKNESAIFTKYSATYIKL